MSRSRRTSFGVSTFACFMLVATLLMAVAWSINQAPDKFLPELIASPDERADKTAWHRAQQSGVFDYTTERMGALRQHR